MIECPEQPPRIAGDEEKEAAEMAAADFEAEMDNLTRRAPGVNWPLISVLLFTFLFWGVVLWAIFK